jgi:hypothetical protein
MFIRSGAFFVVPGMLPHAGGLSTADYFVKVRGGRIFMFRRGAGIRS